MRHPLRHLVLPLAITLTALTLPAPAVAAPTASAAELAPQRTVAAILDHAASRLATSLADGKVRKAVTTAVLVGTVDLAAVSDPALSRTAADVDRAVLAAKGLPASVGSVVQVRLALPQMQEALARGVAPLVATAPTDDVATAVTAYDINGATVLLDPVRVPQRPVLVVETDTAKMMPAGMEVMRRVLAEKGVGPAPATTLAGGYWATKLNAIRVSDDKEPWIKGAAEMYAIAGGFGLDGHPKVDIVQMPYLDYDGTTYYPNQLVVHFNAYKYNLADLVLMEDDGDTNYLQLAQAIAAALLTIADQGAYIPLVSAILNAIPTSWWTDDPDYVDSWYTLSTSSSGHFNGAAANGWIEISPYWVAPL